ncbi:MAG: guanylate kinase [Bacteroidetes bacterium]|nr:guanylate kinase [Bacteroidota bacterium]
MSHKAIIVCAPSGAGKTSIVKHLLDTLSGLSFSISACSRPKRENEIHGKDYYFLTADEFRSRINHGDFVEWEEVYPGSYYGTLKSELERIWRGGKSPVFDVDVKGGISLKTYFGSNALAIYIKPPSIEALESRLRKRGTETEETLRKRLERAEFELGFANNFDIAIINESLEQACSDSVDAITQFLNQR